MSKLSANRVALVAAFITSLAAGIAGVSKTIPGKTGETILTVAGMIGAVGTSLTFAVGSIKWDATPVGQAVQAQKLGVRGIAVLTPAGQADDNRKMPSPPAPAPRPDAGLEADPSLQAGSVEQGPSGDEPAEPEDLNPEVWLAARAAVPDATDATDATEVETPAAGTPAS